MLRAANLDSTSIANSTVTTVPIAGNTSGTQVDSYSGLNGGTSTYTGATTLTAGTLQFAGSNALNGATPIGMAA